MKEGYDTLFAPDQLVSDVEAASPSDEAWAGITSESVPASPEQQLLPVTQQIISTTPDGSVQRPHQTSPATAASSGHSAQPVTPLPHEA